MGVGYISNRQLFFLYKLNFIKIDLYVFRKLQNHSQVCSSSFNANFNFCSDDKTWTTYVFRIFAVLLLKILSLEPWKTLAWSFKSERNSTQPEMFASNSFLTFALRLRKFSFWNWLLALLYQSLLYWDFRKITQALRIQSI